MLASFVHVDAAADAIRALRARGHPRPRRSTRAAPNHEIEEALEHRVSPVRLFTLIGGLTGCTAGLRDDHLDVATTGRLVVGGKPIGSIPPYVVIALRADHPARRAQHRGRGGAVLVLMGKRGVPYDPRFSDDQIGIFVPATPRPGRAGRAAAAHRRGGGGAP